MKIFSKILHFFILIICLLVQIAFFEYLKMFSISFDLIMVVVIAIALFDGTLWGILSGFAAGMMLDLMVGNVVGISAFIYTINAFIVRKMVTAGFKSVWRTFAFIVFLVTEINILLTNLMRYLFNYNINLFGVSLEMMIGPACNIILMFMIFPLIRISSGRGREIEFVFKQEDKI
jgi:rod shape-determining protein MreD